MNNSTQCTYQEILTVKTITHKRKTENKNCIVVHLQQHCVTNKRVLHFEGRREEVKKYLNSKEFHKFSKSYSVLYWNHRL